METHVTGQPVLGELRQHVLSPLVGNPLFSEAEQLRANHFVHECEDVARLTRWHASILAEIARRQATATHQRRQQAQQATLRQSRPHCFRGHRPRPRAAAPAWVPGSPLPDRTDRNADTFDRRAAARFQPVQSLTLTHLLTLPRR